MPAVPEATTHSLLLDMTSSSNGNNANQNRGNHHAHRILAPGPPDILQTIDQMHEGSMQTLQQLPHDGGGTETFRIKVPAGTILQHGRRLTEGLKTRCRLVLRSLFFVLYIILYHSYFRVTSFYR